MDQIRRAVANAAHRPLSELARDESFWRDIQQNFSVSRSVINLNNAGLCASPKPVTDAVQALTMEQEKYPPHSAFTLLPPRMERVRDDLARFFGCDAEELSLVRNATEALQTVIMGVPMRAGDEVLTTDHDYWAMLDALTQRARRDGITVRKVEVPAPPKHEDELVEMFARGITSKTKFILVSHPVNLTGQLFPIKKICDLAHSSGVEVIVDGAQSFGMIDYKLADLGCDYFGTSLHKWLMAPKGTGMLYIRRDRIESTWPLLPAPTKHNKDVRKFEALGTIPMTSLAVSHALAFHQGIGSKLKEERLRYLTQYWVKPVREMPGVHFNTAFETNMSCAIATVGIKGIDPAQLTAYLWEKHRILTTNPSARAKNVNGVRVSPGLQTTLPELDGFLEVMEQITKKGLPG